MSSLTTPRYHAVLLEPDGDLSRHPPPRWQAGDSWVDGSEQAYPLWSKVAAKLDWRIIVPLALLLVAGIGELIGDDYAPSQLPTLISSQVDAFRTSSAMLFGPNDPVSYYSQPGFLTVDHNRTIDDHRQARWLPVSALDALEEQSATGLEAQLDLGLGVEDGFELLEAYRSVVDQDGGYTSREAVDSPSFDYLRNRNVLLFGDSQDRFTIDYMCELLHGTLTLRDFFTPSHGMSLGRIAPQEFWRPAPHVCQLPAAFGNTTIWSVMTYGSFNEDDTWALLRPGEGPDELEVRMNLTAEAFAKEGVKLDFVLFHTLLWDLSTANIFDTYDNRPATSSLSVEYLQLFRSRLRSSLALANELWPDTVKVYRTLHNLKVNKGIWFYRVAPPGVAKIPRAPFMNNKGAALNAATVDILPEYGVLPFDVKHVFAGYQEDYKDAQHYGPTGRLLYVHLLLYYMKHLL